MGPELGSMGFGVMVVYLWAPKYFLLGYYLIGF